MKFQKGRSGNPGGRPKCPLTQEIREALAKPTTILIDGKRRKATMNEKLIHVLTKRAEKGDKKAIEMLWDRGYGKAMQPVDIEGTVEHGIPTLHVEVVETKRGGNGHSTDK